MGKRLHTNPTETIECIKGFDRDWKCRGFAYEIGVTYRHDGEVKLCKAGFHSIGGHPLGVFVYYPPATSRYALVTASGYVDRKAGDSKIASAEITIKAESRLDELIERAVRWVFDRSKPEGAASATGDQGAASATGYQGAAMSIGFGGIVSGKAGNALFLVERADDGEIIHAWAGIVGRDGIEKGAWYVLCEGQPVVVEVL